MIIYPIVLNLMKFPGNVSQQPTGAVLDATACRLPSHCKASLLPSSLPALALSVVFVPLLFLRFEFLHRPGTVLASTASHLPLLVGAAFL
jgi:hypothetical protein